jgi:hypothetical protein
MFDSAGEDAFPIEVPTTEVTRAARSIAAVDPRGESEDELLERLAEVEAARRALESASARLVAELDGRRVTDER